MEVGAIDMDRWQVVVYMKYGYTIWLVMGDNDGAEEMAYEHASNIVAKGPFVKDDRGVTTYFPPSSVEKVKVVPPDVVLNKTEVKERE